MLVFAAHTGARRSELIRSEALDFDFEAGTVLLREKKRAKGKSTTRTVPLTPRLRRVMQAWLATATGRYTFEQEGRPLSVDDATHYLRGVLAGSRWKTLKGWHIFRHSFISNCASRGIDQRMIDAWVGHTTEEMRKRYTHLLPNAQQAALASVFGGE
jgi:integrase